MIYDRWWLLHKNLVAPMVQPMPNPFCYQMWNSGAFHMRPVGRHSNWWGLKWLDAARVPSLDEGAAASVHITPRILVYLCDFAIGRRDVPQVLHWKSLGFGERECHFVWLCFHVGRKEHAKTGTRTSTSPSWLLACKEALKYYGIILQVKAHYFQCNMVVLHFKTMYTTKNYLFYVV
jgi:hypothetical protein